MDYILDFISTRAAERKAAGDAVFQHAVPLTNSALYTQHMKHILTSLQTQCPGSKVSNTILAHGTDGKVYDITKIDDKLLPIVDKVLENSYIVLEF
jgi:hypothetical protein